MIETKIMDIIDLGDSLQKMEIYSQDSLVKYFNIFRIIIKYQNDEFMLIIFLKVLFYFHYLLIPLINNSKIIKSNDSMNRYKVMHLIFLILKCIINMIHLIIIIMNIQNVKLEKKLEIKD